MNDKIRCIWLHELAVTSNEGLSLEYLSKRVVVGVRYAFFLFVSFWISSLISFAL
jgi:hypothetical protein